MTNLIIGWLPDGTPVHFGEFEARPDVLKTLHRVTPAGGVMILAIHRVSPNFFVGAPIKRADAAVIHQGGAIQ